MKLFIVLLSMLTANIATAQITGQILNDKKEPLFNATLTLLNAKDSSLISTSITGSDGKFICVLADSFPLLLKVSAVGFQQQLITLPTAASLSIVMEPAVERLQVAVVVAKKQLIEIKPDRVVFNVENSINATGNNALDLLRKSPGVMIDNNDNILLVGIGVAVYIDNKPSPLTGKELADFLRTLQSSDIAAIELIKNPSAKYEAAGTGGIINIQLKKNKTLGTNGSVNSSYNVGIYSKYNESAAVNYRNKKVNVFGNASIYKGINESYISLYRRQQDSSYDQHSTTINHNKGINVKAGMDFFVNKKNTIGLLATMFRDTWNDAGFSETPITYLPTKQLGSVLIANNTSTGKKLNSNYNINHHYTDTSGRDWNSDIDYGYFTTNHQNYQPNRYTTPDRQTTLEEKNYNIVTRRQINLLTLKSDYEQNFAGGRLSAGIKFSFVKTGNVFEFANIINQELITDSNRSNNFNLQENIQAGYLGYKKKFKKWDMQLGLRAEQTITRGVLSSSNTQAGSDVKRNYFNLFPSGGLAYTLNQHNSFNLNFSRRINRPGYQSLNPFETKLDELSYQKGNPYLKPEYTNSISLSHSFMYKLNTSAGYSKTNDFSAPITDTIEGKRNYIQQRNAGIRQNIFLNISYPFSITKWWSVYANVSGSRAINKVNLGPGYISKIAINSISLYAQQTIILPKKITLEISGFYNSPSIWGGTFLNKRFWGVDAGVQKRLLKDKATIKISVSDIFHSMQWRGISNFGGLYMDASGGWESRLLKLNFSYRFGRKEIKKERNRSTGSEDIKERL